MPKKFITLLLLFLLGSAVYAQNITGKLVDEYGDGLAEIPLQLYTSVNNYLTTSGSDGSFIFDNVTDLSDEVLPKGYLISNNYPNPFNPKTRIVVTLPKAEKVKVFVFNLLGEIIIEENERIYSSGNHFFDLELNNSPSGIYFARVTIGNKYTVTKKMMLIYGSQHLTILDGTSNRSYKNSDQCFQIELETILDSIVAENSIIGRKVFKNLPSLTGNSLNLGNLTIERFCPEIPTVLYEGKVYNTVKIADQCWLKENLNVGVRINSLSHNDNQTDNGIIEKYCYDNDESYCDMNGGFYQWEEAMQYTNTASLQGICPDGWHIPTLAELQILSDAVGGDMRALTAVGQNYMTNPNTNTSGFSALLTGHRSYIDGEMHYLGSETRIWSSTKDGNSYHRFYLKFDYFYDLVNFYTTSRESGQCIRCIKD